MFFLCSPVYTVFYLTHTVNINCATLASFSLKISQSTYRNNSNSDVYRHGNFLLY